MILSMRTQPSLALVCGRQSHAVRFNMCDPVPAIEGIAACWSAKKRQFAGFALLVDMV